MTHSPQAPTPPLKTNAMVFDPSLAIVWLKENLFSNWFSSGVTVLIGLGLLYTVWGIWVWATTEARWSVIPASLPLFFAGRFPMEQYGRLWILLALINFLGGLTWGKLEANAPRFFKPLVLVILGLVAGLIALTPTPWLYRLLLWGCLLLLVGMAWCGRFLAQRGWLSGQGLSIAWSLAFFVGLWLLRGGFGLELVSTNDWSGLLLTVSLALSSILLCFPLGVLLALGRQSNLPAIRWLSIFHIEFFRGIPLISILFMGQVMVPLFLPEGVRPDRVFRAIIGLTIFSAVYMAENVRGGLQAIPKGQIEAANALGLNTPLTLSLVVLPQALKVSIPAIVGQFIGLFQDTTLLSIVGLLELLGLSRSIVSNPIYVGRNAEVYLFIGVIYWLFCYAMSLGSRRLEKSLNTENR